jgi:hypothetical protein
LKCNHGHQRSCSIEDPLRAALVDVPHAVEGPGDDGSPKNVDHSAGVRVEAAKMFRTRVESQC